MLPPFGVLASCGACVMMSAVPTADQPRRLNAVLFEGFELLDVFGPLEVFGALRDRFDVHLVGPTAGAVRSAQGPSALADESYDDGRPADILVVPGGIGTRRLVGDRSFLDTLASWAVGTELVTSVCTGAAVLAAAGLLDGRRATSNKRSFAWVCEQGPHVQWVPEARWVEDGNRWTSSGVAAGIDMALAIVERLHGADLACQVADGIEFEWHDDPSWDPFAAKNGLVPKLQS